MTLSAKYFGALALFLLSFFCLWAASAKAEVSTQCSIDHAVNGAVEFTQCPLSENNDDILNAGFDGARLDPEITQARTPLWVHGACRYTDAVSLGNPLFIPLGRQEDWQAFLDNAPGGVHLADCCLPRGLRVGDVPQPKNTCSAGWRLKAIVDSSNHAKRVALPQSAAKDAGFTLVIGQSEDPAYPVLRFPVQRDDIGAVLPDAAHPEKTYAAQFTCAGAPADTFVEFRLQCSGGEWQTGNGGTIRATPQETHIEEIGTRQVTAIQPRSVQSVSTQNVISRSVTTVTRNPKPLTANKKPAATKAKPAAKTVKPAATTNDPDLGCIRGSILPFVEACPSGQTGFITKRKFITCAGEQKTKVVSRTCRPAGGASANCPPANVRIVTRQCLDGLTGTITRKEYTDCFGRPKSDVVAYHCSLPPSGCIESTILERHEPCPNGGAGFIRARYYKSCPDGGRKYQQVENLCL